MLRRTAVRPLILSAASAVMRTSNDDDFRPLLKIRQSDGEAESPPGVYDAGLRSRACLPTAHAIQSVSCKTQEHWLPRMCRQTSACTWVHRLQREVVKVTAWIALGRPQPVLCW